jgi:hypothetical protein
MKSDPSIERIAADPSARSRPHSYHEHVWPGIDQALTPLPGTDVVAAAIARDLDPALTIVGPTPPGGLVGNGGICVTPLGGGTITVRIDTRGTGHMFPSGAAHDRRAWLEITAFDARDRIVFSSGVVPDDKDVDDIADPNLFGLWDRTFRTDGTPAHFFWDVARVNSKLLPPPVTLDPRDPAFDHSATATYVVGAVASQIDHITARVRVRALPRALLRELVASGDLDARVAAHAPRTLEIAGSLRHWTRNVAQRQIPNTGCIASPYD